MVTTNAGVGWGTPQWDIIRQMNFDLADKSVDFTKTGKGATIIYFDTEENMLANESSGQPQKMRDEFKDYWAGPYIVDRYEVCAHC